MNILKINILKTLVILFSTSLLFVGCEKDNMTTDQFEEDSTDQFEEAQAKSTFNAENAYNRVLNSKSAKDDFAQNYTAVEQAAIWEYKYERYLTNNSLTTEEEALVDDLKDLVGSPDFFRTPSNYELDAESLEIQVIALFEKEAPYLLYSLENDRFDLEIDPELGEPEPIETDPEEPVANGCFWCYEEVTGPGADSGPCEAQVNDQGEIIQFLRNNVKVKKKRFWITAGTAYISNVPCSMDDWLNDGGGIRTLP